ncbi:MAG: PaaI family thioesterase [Sulfuriferula sp.]
MNNKLPTLEFLRRQLDGTLPAGAITEMQYPTAISKTLGFRITEIDVGYAKVQMDANVEMHGNQQGTVHGGMLCELADATIGTAHSTAILEGETFTSIDLKISFFRPVWKSVLTATAKQIQHGKTITHYQCEIFREDGKAIALAMSTVMTLRGNSAHGR